MSSNKASYDCGSVASILSINFLYNSGFPCVEICPNTESQSRKVKYFGLTNRRRSIDCKQSFCVLPQNLGAGIRARTTLQKWLKHSEEYGQCCWRTEKSGRGVSNSIFHRPRKYNDSERYTLPGLSSIYNTAKNRNDTLRSFWGYQIAWKWCSECHWLKSTRSSIWHLKKISIMRVTRSRFFDKKTSKIQTSLSSRFPSSNRKLPWWLWPC